MVKRDWMLASWEDESKMVVKLVTSLLLAGLNVGHCPTLQEPVKVPRVALIWTYAENEKGTSEGGMRTANDLLKKLFEEKAGYEIVSSAIVKQAAKDLGQEDRPSTVEDPGQLPRLPSDKEILALGQKAGVDFVCVGTLSWRVRSVWVGLGPKTKADAVVSCRIVDVSKATVALDAQDVNSASTKAEKWFESAGAILLTWGITLFSGGPKTPHIQKAGVKAIGAATDPFFQVSSGRKIGG